MTAKQIEALRKRLNLDRQAFATAIGVKETTVWRWEGGRSKPHGVFVQKMRDLAGTK